MNSIKKEIIPALIATILVGMIGYLTGIHQAEELIDLLVPSGILLIVFILFLFSYRYVLRNLVLYAVKHEFDAANANPKDIELRDKLRGILNGPNGSRNQEIYGLVGWYDGFEESVESIRSSLKDAKLVKLLTYNGISDIGKATSAYKAIASNGHAQVQVLLCSPNSPYVSSGFAKSIGAHEERSIVWQKRIRQTIEDLENLGQFHKIDVEYRFHTLPFVWRIWIIDDIMFVSAMLYYSGSRNSTIPVYQLVRSDSSEIGRLFEMFEKYFDEEWKKASGGKANKP